MVQKTKNGYWWALWIEIIITEFHKNPLTN